MHLAAWLSVLSCLVRLVSLVHLVYLSCPSRLSVLSYLSIALLSPKDLVDDLTYMCTYLCYFCDWCWRRDKLIKVICSCSFASSSSSSSSSYPPSCSAPLPVPLRLSWVSAKSDKQVQNCIPFICLPIQSVSQPASQLHIVCVEVPFHSIPPSTVQSRFVSFQRERERVIPLPLPLSFSVQAAA